jgi:hypothetical protein
VTGSGSSAFAVFATARDAHRMVGRVDGCGKVAVCRTLGRNEARPKLGGAGAREEVSVGVGAKCRDRR